MELTIHIPGLENLAAAINSLALTACGAFSHSSAGATSHSTAVPVPQATVQQQVPTQSTVPTQPIAPASTQAVSAPLVTPPIQPVQPPVQQPVQTTTAVYQMDDLAKAAMTLMDAGRMAELQQLLASFGVASLPELPAEKYGAFATALRDKGAQI